MLVYIILLVLSFHQNANAKSSTAGRDFYFGILQLVDGYIGFQDNIITLDVTNVSPVDAQVHLIIPFFNNDTHYDIPSFKNLTIRIPAAIQRQGTFKEKRGIRITSDTDVTVMVTNRFNHGNMIDVYNVLPVTSLGQRYVLSSYSSVDSYPRGSAFIVTGMFDNTSIQLQINNSISELDINGLEVYQYVCDYKCDLTGTLLIAKKEISVTSGVTFSFFRKGRDYLASEQFPTSLWSSCYIVPSVIPTSTFFLRVLAEQVTKVILSNVTRSFTQQFDKLSGKSDLLFSTLPVLIRSDKDIGVTLYGLQDNSIGDIFMATVPAINQYINNHVFTIPRAYYGDTKHYVAIIVPLAEKDSLMLDGEFVQSRNASTGDIQQLNVPHPFHNYTVLTFQTVEGVHHFWHPVLNVTFGVFVYGLGTSMAYGFWAGYDLTGSEVAAEATTTTTTTTPSQSTVTCFKCEDATHQYLCDTVQHCQINEVCYLERYVNSGQVKYRSGCESSSICANRHAKQQSGNSQCYHCCNASYCNIQGCAEPSIPNRDRRGPICYNCEHIASPDECLTVAPCEINQVCIVEEYTWFDHFRFKMGCGHGPCMQNFEPIVRKSTEKRSSLVCQHCCEDDYCNRDCTRPPLGIDSSNIIG